MASTHLLLTFVVTFISPLIISTESSDKIQPSAITVQKGHSVKMTVQRDPEEKEFDVVDWLKDNSDILVSYNFEEVKIPNPSYKERLEFNSVSYSLRLKNIQQADSGLYTARASGESDTILARYNVTVGTSRSGSTAGSVSLTWMILLFLFGVMMI